MFRFIFIIGACSFFIFMIAGWIGAMLSLKYVLDRDPSIKLGVFDFAVPFYVPQSVRDNIPLDDKFWRIRKRCFTVMLVCSFITFTTMLYLGLTGSDSQPPQ